MRKGEPWPAAFKGHGEVRKTNHFTSLSWLMLQNDFLILQLDPMASSEVKKQMMLERFQEEHPGFDFSGAEFSGDAPDPRSFMGGVKYK